MLRPYARLLFVSCLFAAPAQAYTVKGGVTCQGVIEEDARAEYRNMNKWWLLGYISARNFENNADVGANVESDALYGLALGYCKSNPAQDWDDAAQNLYKSLS